MFLGTVKASVALSCKSVESVQEFIRATQAWQLRLQNVNTDTDGPRLHIPRYLASASKLKLRPDSSVVAWAEKQKLYCLCRSVYRAGDKMVECDMCHEWFHFSCDPNASDDVDPYVCPVCSNGNFHRASCEVVLSGIIDKLENMAKKSEAKEFQRKRLFFDA